MSRSGYSEDCEQWALIRWRGAVESAIRGKRGQAFLKELEAALVALPEKKLCAGLFADPEKGEVCAIGSVALKRRMDTGMEKMSAIKDIYDKYPEDTQADQCENEFNIAGALAKEIAFMNDDEFCYRESSENRYENVLKWVRENIKSSPSTSTK